MVDLVPQAVRDAEEAAHTKWFDDTIARLFIIRASDVLRRTLFDVMATDFVRAS